MLSQSADGRYQVLVTPWEAANTHWVYRPRIIDTRQGSCLLAFEDARWSAEHSTWHGDSTVELTLRKYPGNQAVRSIQVLIDCAGRQAQVGSRSHIEPAALEGILDYLLHDPAC